MDITSTDFQMFDEVKIKILPGTLLMGIANKTGTVLGITVPSQSKVKVEGKLKSDLAVKIEIEEKQI